MNNKTKKASSANKKTLYRESPLSGNPLDVLMLMEKVRFKRLVK